MLVGGDEEDIASKQGLSSAGLQFKPSTTTTATTTIARKNTFFIFSHLFLNCFSVESAMLLIMEGFYGPLGGLKGQLCSPTTLTVHISQIK